MQSKNHQVVLASRAGVAALAVGAALAIGAPGAQAASCATPSPSSDQYCPSFTHNSGGSSSGGGLPFTGYDVGLAALAAAGLLGAGTGLGRLARREGGA